MSELKAVFMDTGGGDIYAGPTKEACLAEMKEEGHSDDEISQAYEIDGSSKMSATDENEELTGELVTLDEEYMSSEEGYCIASNNC